MAWALSTSTTMDELVVALKGPAMLALRQASLMAPGSPGHNLMRVQPLPKGAKSYQFNVGNTFTVYGVTEGEDHAISQAYDPTGVAVTATEKIGISSVTDYGAQAVIDQVDTAITFELGRAMGYKWDYDVFALNNALNGATKAGTTNTDLNFEDIALAVEYLQANNAPPPFTLVIHPDGYYELATEGTLYLQDATGGAGTLGETLRRDYFVMPLPILGCVVYITNNIPADSTATDYENVVYSGEPAIGCVLMQHPIQGGPWNNIVEIERDASERAYEVVLTSCFGVGEIRDPCGVCVLSNK